MATISLEDCLATIAQKTPTRVVISNPKSTQNQFMRVELESVGTGFQITKKTTTQAFHEHISQRDLYQKLLAFMTEFQQLNAFTAEVEYHVRLTKKGKVQSGEKTLATKEKASEKERISHNREKNTCCLKASSLNHWWIWAYSPKMGKWSKRCTISTSKLTAF